MKRKLPKKLLIASITAIVILLIVTLLIVWKYWGKAKYEEWKYPFFRAEVLEWDPGSGIVRIRINVNGTILKENLIVDPQVTNVIFNQKETRENIGEVINVAGISDKMDANWEKLFCPGDRISFAGNRFAMKKVPNEETLEGAHTIYNWGPATCREKQ